MYGVCVLNITHKHKYIHNSGVLFKGKRTYSNLLFILIAFNVKIYLSKISACLYGTTCA